LGKTGKEYFSVDKHEEFQVQLDLVLFGIGVYPSNFNRFRALSFTFEINHPSTLLSNRLRSKLKAISRGLHFLLVFRFFI
jgi:hypothetical protein